MGVSYTSGGLKIHNFEVPARGIGQRADSLTQFDLLYSDLVPNRRAGKVQLCFHHALASVRFTIGKEGRQSYKIESVRLLGIVSRGSFDEGLVRENGIWRAYPQWTLVPEKRADYEALDRAVQNMWRLCVVNGVLEYSIYGTSKQEQLFVFYALKSENRVVRLASDWIRKTMRRADPAVKPITRIARNDFVRIRLEVRQNPSRGLSVERSPLRNTDS